MGEDASRRQQVTPHLPLSLWLGQCCAVLSPILTQTCVCKTCAHVCVCLRGCVLHGAKSDLCVHVCAVTVRVGLERECYDINLLGTGSAVCWHVSPFHADNVKYLSAGVCVCVCPPRELEEEQIIFITFSKKKKSRTTSFDCNISNLFPNSVCSVVFCLWDDSHESWQEVKWDNMDKFKLLKGLLCASSLANLNLPVHFLCAAG